MPGQIQAVPGAAIFGATIQAAIRDESESTLWTEQWTYRRRGIRTDQNHLYTWQDGRWPNRSTFLSDPAVFETAIGRDANRGLWSGSYQPWLIGYGVTSLKFIMGQCLDSGSAPVPNAVVQGFLTATDQFVRETTASPQGYYEFGTEYPGQNHYLVAYKAGSPDIAGTTVNTLIPTNRDGT